MRALVGNWRPDGKPTTTGAPVLVHIGVRQADGNIALAFFKPDLDSDVGEPIGVLLLRADDAAQLLDRLMRGLDETGETETVDRKVSARARALAEG